MATETTARPSGFGRWWVYQKERFPVLAHGPLVAVFSFSALSFSTLLRGVGGPSVAAAVVAFASCVLLFLQLRISDEFKDFEDDARFRPYRPVPRGLVALRELGWVAVGAAVLQLVAACLLSVRLLPLLLVVWIYMGLMGREFFVGEWLRRHPVVYLWSHMLIMPLVDLYATACDWRVAGAQPPAGLTWFLVLSFFNGVVLEIGRKIRAPEDEETGVETYSALWGRGGAVAAWLAAMVATAVSAALGARLVGFAPPVAAVLGALLLVNAVLAARFLRRPAPGAGRVIEAVSGVWTLALYLSVGVVPRLLRAG